MPALTYYLLKWDERMVSAGLAVELKPLTWSEQFYYPFCFYLVWQLIYFYIQYTVIEKDKTLITSLRYLVNDHKNPSTKVGSKLAVRMGKLQIIILKRVLEFHIWNYRIHQKRWSIGSLQAFHHLYVCLIPIAFHDSLSYSYLSDVPFWIYQCNLLDICDLLGDPQRWFILHPNL